MSAFCSFDWLNSVCVVRMYYFCRCMETNYLEQLNESQRAAVLYNDGPSLVIAGAGSGKTRVLTCKIAYLLEQGYQPWSILALTFTNKAAREMRERISRQVGPKARYLWMGTFHSVFSRILRAESAGLGFSSRFTVYDAADSKSLIRSILKEMKLDEKKYKPGSVQSRISNAKNNLLTPDAYVSNRQIAWADEESGMPLVGDIYKKYWERCRQADAMDFDDLLLYTFLLFRDCPEVLERYRDQFRYILVDEYQDTNIAQHRIVHLLAGSHQHLCVVGDDAQSIYSFRGADIDNILYFTKQYQNTRVFKLEQNYRSTQILVEAANSLIAKNRWQIRKEVYSRNAAGEAIPLVEAYSDVEEGEIVTGRLLELKRRHGYEFADFAILYRTNAQSRVFEEAFRKRGIPYRIYGGLSFYQRKEIKDVIAYCRLVVNPHDEEALKRVINYPARGIGETTVNRIIEAASVHHVSLWTVLADPFEYNLKVNKGTCQKLQAFRNCVEECSEKVAEMNAFELTKQIVRASGIGRELMSQDLSPENLSRKENVEELLNGISNFCMTRLEEGNPAVYLPDFLSEVALLTDQDTEEEESDRTVLMTVHSAKGLEFKNVFVVGLEEGLFPSLLSTDSPKAVEEERRLLYVAITRAEEHCVLSYAKSRYRYGKMEFTSPSRFLKDIDVECLDLPAKFGRVASNVSGSVPPKTDKPAFRTSPAGVLKKVGISKPAMSETLSSVTTPDGQTLAVGQQIAHERFGVGCVTRLEGSGENLKATIQFEHAGVKQLLLRFARFKILS